MKTAFDLNALKTLGREYAPGAGIGALSGGAYGALNADEGDALSGGLQGAAAGGLGGALMSAPRIQGNKMIADLAAQRGHPDLGALMQNTGKGQQALEGIVGGLGGSHMTVPEIPEHDPAEKIAMNAFEAGRYDALAKLGFAPALMAAGRAAIGAAKPAAGMAARAFGLGGRQAMKSLGAAGKAGMGALQQGMPGMAKGLQTAGKVMSNPMAQMGMMAGASAL